MHTHKVLFEVSTEEEGEQMINTLKQMKVGDEIGTCPKCGGPVEISGTFRSLDGYMRGTGFRSTKWRCTKCGEEFKKK